jgi:ABC-type multidrug transport system fused ATPase/permease subunit
MAWSTNNEYVMPYIIWFRGEYELGLDFALLMLILPMGLCEVVVSKLMKELELTQRNSMHHEIDKLSNKYINYYKKSMMIVAFGAAISAVLVIILVSILRSGKFENLSKVYYFSYITNFVFYWALIAYSFISMSLTNVVILFSLSQPIMVTKPLAIALFINFFIGFMFSRWFEYYAAVFGLFIGSMVFFVLSTGNLLKVLKKLDYYIYAAS